MCVSLSFPHSLSVSLAHTLPLSISLSLSHSHGVHASCYATALPTAQEGDCHLLVKSFAETCSGKKKKHTTKSLVEVLSQLPGMSVPGMSRNAKT